MRLTLKYGLLVKTWQSSSKNLKALYEHLSNIFLPRFLNAFFYLIFFISCPALSTEIPAEAQVKAAFVYNFVKFTDWPPTVFPSPQSPMYLCLNRSKNNHFNAFTALEGRIVQGRPLQVKVINRVDEIKTCHVLYISDAEDKFVSEAIRATNNLPILTVSDADDFAESGGMIGLVVVNSGIQFEINQEATKRVNLNLSAQLLRLARTTDAKGKHQ